MSNNQIQENKAVLSQYWLIIRSFLLSFYYELWLKRNNFNKIKSLHNPIYENNTYEYTKEEIIKIRQIFRLIKIVEKKAFWKPKCYNLALLARKLLLEHNIPNSLEIGFRKRNNKIEGHAWVQCDNIVVSGFLSDLNTYNRLKPVNKTVKNHLA